jgi:protein-L-isoaspartate(D-aspartate) O-methyltransferase
MSLIDELIYEGYLKTPEIIEAFRKIKREDFLRAGDEEKAEINAPLSIGYGQTVSQPLTVAFMLELLDPGKGDRILDVGSGSGWTVALLSEVVGEKGQVYGLEIIPELKNFAETNVSKYNFIKKGIAQIICADGYQGLPKCAPFDKIIVAAAAEEMPDKLLGQLKVGGRLVIPVGQQYESQDMVVIDKTGEDEFKEERYPGFIFVPLVKDN